MSANHRREAADARREARQSWPSALHRMGDEPSDDLSDVTSAAERIAMMWPLAVEVWEVAGRLLPSYDRASIPARLFRPGEPRPDDDGTP